MQSHFFAVFINSNMSITLCTKPPYEAGQKAELATWQQNSSRNWSLTKWGAWFLVHYKVPDTKRVVHGCSLSSLSVQSFWLCFFCFFTFSCTSQWLVNFHSVFSCSPKQILYIHQSCKVSRCWIVKSTILDKGQHKCGDITPITSTDKMSAKAAGKRQLVSSDRISQQINRALSIDHRRPIRDFWSHVWVWS